MPRRDLSKPLSSAALPSGTAPLRAFAILLLAGLAVTGNHLHLTLFFGVDVIFGSVAVLLTLVWFGGLAGLLVAAAAAAYTLVLWDHPYAFGIFVAEAGFVAWWIKRAGRTRGAVDDLLTGVALYWLLLGIPLVLVCYRYAIGMTWAQTLLVAVKQPLNALLNAGLAGLVLVPTALLRSHWARRGAMARATDAPNTAPRGALPTAPPGQAGLPARQVLFTLFLAAILLPAFTVLTWQNRDLKTHLEDDLAARLRLFGVLAVPVLTDDGDPVDRAPTQAARLARLTTVLSEALPAGSQPRLLLETHLSSPTLPRAGDALGLVFPPGSPPSRMDRWRGADYRLSLPLAGTDDEPVGTRLTILVRAAPLVDRLQAGVTAALGLLLGVTLLGILVAGVLSRYLVAPLERIAASAVGLPQRILCDAPLSLPPPGLLAEHGTLTRCLREMAEHLAVGFRQLIGEHEAQVRERAVRGLQAQMLGWLVRECGDERDAAEQLCRLIGTLLPPHRAVLIAPDAGGRLRVLAAPVALAAATGPPVLLVTGCEAAAFASAQPRQGWARVGGEPATDESSSQWPEASSDQLPAAGSTPSAGLGTGVATVAATGPAAADYCISRPVIGSEGRVLGVLTLRLAAPGDGPAAPTPTPGDAAPAAASDPFIEEVLQAATDLAALAFDTLRLRRRHALVLEAVSQAGTGIFIAERTAAQRYRIAFVNRGFETLTGYREAEVLGRSMGFLPGNDGDQPGNAEAQTAIRAGQPCQVLLRQYRKDGSSFINALGLTPLRNARGEVTHYVGVQRDVTGEQALATALREQRERYRLVVENVLDLVVRTDAAGRLVFVSPSFCRLFGRSAAALRGQRYPLAVHAADQAATASAWASLWQPPHTARLEHRSLTIDGWRWLQWVDRAILDTDGAVTGIVAIGRDITERKEAELELIQREALEGVLLDLAAMLVNQPAGGLDAAIDAALARLGACTGADRAFLMLIDPGGETMTNTHEWTATGVAPARPLLQREPVAPYTATMTHLRRGQPLVLPRVTELGDDWAAERAVLARQGVQSLLLVPLCQRGEVAGMVGFDAVQAVRDWSATEVRFLQVFANLLLSAWERERGEAAVRDSNERYDQLARQSRTMAWETDAAGRYTYVSPVSELLVGQPPAALLGRHFTELFPAVLRADYAATAQRMIDALGTFEDFLNPLQHADGRLVWCLTDALPLRAADGTLLGYRGSDVDITAQYEARERLRASEAQLSAMFDHAPIGMALVAPDHRLLRYNRALAEFLGRTPAQLADLTFDAVTHPQDLRADARLFDELVAGERDFYRLTKRYLRPDGGEVWGDLRVALLPPDRAGEPPTPLGMVEDISEYQAETARRQALERALAAYTQRLETLVDISSRTLSEPAELRALLRLGCDGLALAGGTLATVVGAGAQAVLRGLVCYRADPNAGPDAPAGDAAVLLDWNLSPPMLAAILASIGEPQVLPAAALPPPLRAVGADCAIAIGLQWPEHDQPRRQIMLYWGRADCTGFAGPARELVRLIGQRVVAVQFEAQLQRALVVAKERETIGHLASGVAHDFNNLLGIIDANLYEIKEALAALDDAALTAMLQETESALGQAKVVTSGMAALSRVGGIPLASVELGGVIDDLVRILCQLLPTAVHLRVELAPGLHACTNQGFLQAALLNLVLNARDAMPAGGVLTIVSRILAWDGTAPGGAEVAGDGAGAMASAIDRSPLVVGELSPGVYAEVSVTDTGRGMSTAVQARLFEPLFSTKTAQRGHGLGLFMVHEFLRRSGAGLALTTAPGAGSRFRLLLPLGAGGVATPPVVRDGQPTVLLVDDDARLREAVARLFERGSVHCVQAEHGAAALALLAQAPTVDLVLSDLTMPVLDGIGLYRALATHHPGLPVLLMSGQPPSALEALPGRPRILRKPLDPAELSAALAACGVALGN